MSSVSSSAENGVQIRCHGCVFLRPLLQTAESARSRGLVRQWVYGLLEAHALRPGVLQASYWETGESAGDKRVSGSAKQHCPLGVVFVKDSNELN